MINPSNDIVLLESERMTDATDGGGRMTSNVIADGIAGNIFPKVSRLDTVYGRDNLRQVFGAVRSDNADTFAGAHAAILTPPANSRIGVLLFSTGSHSATRDQLRNWIESYVVGGPLSRLRLYGNQTQGQRAILCYQRAEEPLPDVGNVLQLSVESGGVVSAQQFVRIDDVTHDVRTFTDGEGEFTRRVVSIKLTTPLSQTFLGAEPSRYSVDVGATKVRDTQVADSARYFGIKRLTTAAAIGSLNLQLSSIYSPLVPSTERETPISQVQPQGAFGYVRAGDPITTYLGELRGGDKKTYRAPTAIFPGSWSMPEYSIHDDGAGNIVGQYGTTGTIDYEAGAVTITYAPESGAGSTGRNQTYAPMVVVQTRAHTHQIPITLANRGTVYTYTLTPLPAPGSVVVEYKALGKWYRLRDNGSGGLSGNNVAEGSGLVSASSGALIATLGALPDIDSSVIVSWASPTHYTQRAGAAAANDSMRAELRFALSSLPVKQGSLVLKWRNTPYSQQMTITETAPGVLSGSDSSRDNYPGRIDTTTGEISIPVPTNPWSHWQPGLDTLIEVEYQQEVPTGAAPLVTSSTVAVSNPSNIDIGMENIAPRSVRIVFPIFYNELGTGFPLTALVTAIDNGAGQLITLFGSVGSSYMDTLDWPAGLSVGTIDYATGLASMSSFSARRYRWDAYRRAYAIGGTWTQESISLSAGVGEYTISTKSVATSFVTVSETIDVADYGYTYDLTASTGDAVVPGSVYLDFGTFKIYDRQGNLYYAFNSTTGLGTLCGSMDYESGKARLMDLPSNVSMDVYVTPIRSCLTTRGEFSVIDAVFRTAGSPVRPASVYVQALGVDGVMCSGTADVNGVMSGTHLRGMAHAPSGVVAVEFGDLVGTEWVPREVWPASIRYSCVVLSNIPLDANILGLDPLRLPSDGRVPVVRQGDVAIVHETGKVTLPNPAVAGSTISSGRSPRVTTDSEGAEITIPAVVSIELRDAANQLVPANRYVADLVAGTITLATPLDLTGYTQPLTMSHRVEDMATIADAQINGDVSLSSPTLYAYTDSAYLSTALLFGDLAARVEHVFDQQSWTGVWSDTLIGSESSGQFNVLQYPIEVKNNGAEKQRWRAQVTSISPLTVQIYGEDLGLIGVFPATADIAPVNPLTGATYFTLRKEVWGAGGWSTGNNVRFNTVSASAPIDVVRTILSGAARTGDAFYLAFRGDID